MSLSRFHYLIIYSENNKKLFCIHISFDQYTRKWRIINNKIQNKWN